MSYRTFRSQGLFELANDTASIHQRRVRRWLRHSSADAPKRRVRRGTEKSRDHKCATHQGSGEFEDGKDVEGLVVSCV